ncbi:MAG TPA: ABC transporter permease, partial [Patescibacteria group bacterium]|nr:ABC transporter permease [Patescibacteria group bacterium]
MPEDNIGRAMSHERRAPQPGLYIADHRSTGPLLTLFRYRELLRQLVIREVKLRYKRSALGFAWTVLNPLLAMVIFTMVFSRIFSNRPNYSLYVFTALLGWNLFSLGTSRGLDSVVLNGPIIRKVFVPKAIFPVATVVSQVVNFVFTLVPLFLLMAAVGAGFSLNLLWLPIPLVSLTCFALGIALLFGTFNVFFRDVKYFYEAGLLAWFYATPIFYPPEIIPDKFKFLLYMNPMFALLESLRAPVYLGAAPHIGMLIFGLALSLVTLAIGWIVFHRFESRFIHYV